MLLKYFFLSFFGCLRSWLWQVGSLLHHAGSLTMVFRLSGCVRQAPEHAGSVVGVPRLSCFAACGIFLDQESNTCLLHWQVYSLPMSHWGSPLNLFLASELVYFLALPMMHHTEAGGKKSPICTADTENLASVFTSSISPRAFAKL